MICRLAANLAGAGFLGGATALDDRFVVQYANQFTDSIHILILILGCNARHRILGKRYRGYVKCILVNDQKFVSDPHQVQDIFSRLP